LPNGSALIAAETSHIYTFALRFLCTSSRPLR
jgi:hypothetical protein